MIKFRTGLLIFIFLYLPFAFAQPTPEGIFMRTYKAPDFRLRQLIVGGNGGGQGLVVANATSHTFQLNPNLTFNHFSNSQQHQGIMNVSFTDLTRLNLSNSVSNFETRQGLSNDMNHWFYLGGNRFVGFHDRSSAAHGYLTSGIDSIPAVTNYNVRVRPAVSIGFGRVEWVQFARQTLDIEHSLTQFGRLSPTYDAGARTLVADKIAHIRNRRYYDTRLGRIDQLQALDSVFQQKGMITSPDIVYFSQLQDAFLYSYQMSRLSGFRHELGVTEGFGISGSGNAAAQLASDTYGFYSFSWYLPQSYAIQHNLKVSALGGLQFDLSSSSSTVPVWVDFSYTFGLYPTTRTYFGVTANSGMNYESGNLGYIYGAVLDGYYYLSPRFRFFGSAQFNDGQGYRSHGFSHVAVFNRDRVIKALDYNFTFGITYAIF